MLGNKYSGYKKDVDPRVLKCVIGTETVAFLVDSGSTVNTVSINIWETIRNQCKSAIQEVTMFPKVALSSYANDKPMDVLCSFSTFVAVKGKLDKKMRAKFFVIKGTDLSLLGFQTSCALGVLKVGLQASVNFIEPVLRQKADYIFPKIPVDAIKFRINKDVPPKQIIRYNIPQAFESTTNERLDAMQQKGIIERADKDGFPITFVSPLVLVPKGKNDFRIVVDYREVNKAIIREPYPMPSLERIWTEIPAGNGCLLFSKLDLKDAYFHVELDKEVRHVTTFMTANGLMRFKR